jgi:diguanylate cyclase (GGDEF)-like protein
MSTLLRKEQDFLAMVIDRSDEGMVLTDHDGSIVRVNPAAEQLLQKPAARIVEDGFGQLLGDRQEVQRWLAGSEGKGPIVLEYKGRFLRLRVTTIMADDGQIVGSAAWIREVSEEKRLENDLARLSTTDALTGLHNRRFLDEALDTEFHRALRSHSPLSIVMFEVDHLGQVGDQHGDEHRQGQSDRILQSVAATTRMNLRKYDMACRYGDEKFLAILPDTGLEGACHVGERLRADVMSIAVDGLRVTVSLGIATFPVALVETPDELIEKAGQAVQRSKECGHNHLTVATPDASEAG